MSRVRALIPILGLLVFVAPGRVPAQPAGGGVFASTAFDGAEDVQRSSAAVDVLARAGRLRLVDVERDPVDPERLFEYYVGQVGPARVLGTSVTRVVGGDGARVVVGSVPFLDAELPRLEAEVAAASASGWAGWRSACGEIAGQWGSTLVDVEALAGFGLPLIVYSNGVGPSSAAWRCHVGDGRDYIVSAVGEPLVLGVHDMVVSQGRPAVGSGQGLDGQVKTVFTTQDRTGFVAEDQLRVPGIFLLDGRFDDDLVDWFVTRPAEGVQRRFLARDGDNVWPPELVDAHAHLGWSYDYFRSRFGWLGFDGHDRRIVAVVNVRENNAYFYPPPRGPEGTGLVGFGTSGVQPYVNLDVVAHELGHSIVEYSVSRRTGSPVFRLERVVPGRSEYAALAGGRPWRCGEVALRLEHRGRVIPGVLACEDGRFLLWSNEGGAVHEAYADIFAVSASRHAYQRGAVVAPDWEVDAPDRVIRSLAAPESVTAKSGLGHPRRYDQRYSQLLGSFPSLGPGLWPVNVVVRGDRVVFPVVSSSVVRVGRDLCCAHWNSTILSHAFHLAVEGTGVVGAAAYVEGVGEDGRELVEQIWFRALRHFLPNELTLPMASRAIHQAARDLTADIPGGAVVYEAVAGGLSAVGLGIGPR